uniref:Ribosomal protein S7 n=1 Tax=Gonatozygon brebissonii TaxID=184482 RepID=A0A6G9IGS6_9VIRI|nr:ribosomal protein S7 [Gonatozygon brebissonii]QIQ23054.1 ribosomal protein S7 [Gonatozygon brebissonii]
MNVAEQRCLQKFINLCMVDGKKNKSQKILINTLYRLQRHGDVITFLIKAVENVKPIIEVKKVRIAGSTQLVPSVIPKKRQESLAIRWILEAACKRRLTKKSLGLDECLFAELLDATNQIGTVRKRRDDLHKLAESNRGFAHYRWW